MLDEEDEGGRDMQGSAVLVQYEIIKNNVRRNLVAIVDLQE